MRVDQKNLSALTQWFTRPHAYPTTRASVDEWMQLGRKKALLLFRQAAVRVPAYSSFLRMHRISVRDVRTVHDLSYVPVTTKENYIEAYETWQRSWDGKSHGTHMISTSSATTGASHYWPRSLRHDIDGAIVHEFFLRSTFHIDAVPTLFINGFAMGNWIAGTFTLSSASLVAWKGYPMTIMTPGYDKDAIVAVLQDVAPYFAQTIMTGHTPFLKEIAEEIALRKRRKKLRIYLLGTGQGISESWRTRVTSLVGGTDIHRTILNLYGSADASLMGFETPVSIATRRAIETNMTGQKIFASDRLPSLYQYDPIRTHFEVVGDELCITKDSGCPLIRYNIHDTGGLFEYDALSSLVSDSRIDAQKTRYPWKLPYVYLFGRDKFMVKIYGANIYIEHGQKAFEHEKLRKYITGKFIFDTGFDRSHNPFLIVRVELRENHGGNKKLAMMISRVFIEEVRRVNSEYRFVLETLGTKVHPKIELYPRGHPKYFPKGVVKKTE